MANDYFYCIVLLEIKDGNEQEVAMAGELIVGVNKMFDKSVNHTQNRYNEMHAEIKNTIYNFIYQCLDSKIKIH